MGRKGKEKENSKTLCSSSGEKLNLDVSTDSLPRTEWRREHGLFIYVLYSLIITMCQPLGATENCCQSLCLLRHQPQGVVQLGPGCHAITSPIQLGLHSASTTVFWWLGGRAEGRAAASWIVFAMRPNHSSLSLTPDLWLSVLSLKTGRMLIRIFTLEPMSRGIPVLGYKAPTNRCCLFFTVWSSPVLNEPLCVCVAF